MQPTEAELNLLTVLRLLKPYEKVTIHCDREGKPGFFRVNKVQDLIISDEGITEVK